jgi:hypothetical protein
MFTNTQVFINNKKRNLFGQTSALLRRFFGECLLISSVGYFLPNKTLGVLKKMSNIGGMINKTVMGVITAVVFILVGIALGPTVTAAIADINATSMADVFLGTVIVTLSDFLPFFYYLGIVLGGLALIWAATRSY